MDTRLLEATVVSYFQDKHWARLIYLFGSRAKGTETGTSDIDIAYWADPPAPALRRFEIWADLATRLDTDKLDVVDLARASLLLRYEVAAEGKPLLVRSEAERIDFESRAYMQYLDFRPSFERMRTHIHPTPLSWPPPSATTS